MSFFTVKSAWLPRTPGGSSLLRVWQERKSGCEFPSIARIRRLIDGCIREHYGNVKNREQVRRNSVCLTVCHQIIRWADRSPKMFKVSDFFQQTHSRWENWSKGQGILHRISKISLEIFFARITEKLCSLLAYLSKIIFFTKKPWANSTTIQITPQLHCLKHLLEAKSCVEVEFKIQMWPQT